MTEQEEEIVELWKRALDSLQAAEIMLREGFADFAASRAYYAAFYAASALLLSAGKSFSKHSAVIAHVHKDYVKEGKLPPVIGRTLNALFDLRNVGDYGRVLHVDKTRAERAIADGKSFVEAVRELLPSDVRRRLP